MGGKSKKMSGKPIRFDEMWRVFRIKNLTRKIGNIDKIRIKCVTFEKNEAESCWN